MSTITRYSTEFYPSVRNCTRCGTLRLQNCFHCRQEEECTTFPHCAQPVAESYPPEFAFIGQDYGATSPRLLFLAQVPAWNLDNVADREEGDLADVVPTHETYEAFLKEYRKGFPTYHIVTRKYGVLDICRHVFNSQVGQNLLKRAAYTNAAKCPNRSGMESAPNPGYTGSQARSDITVLLANCREHLLEEITVLDPDVVISFDRTFLPLLSGHLGLDTDDEVSLAGKVSGRERLCVTFHHPSMAGVNYARGGVSFAERIKLIQTHLKNEWEK